jgi:hypothetical protein
MAQMSDFFGANVLSSGANGVLRSVPTVKGEIIQK